MRWCWLGVLLCVALGARGAPPAVALFYGPKPPFNELKAFDVVVVDPDNPGVDPAHYRRADSELFAYVSVGEVRKEKPYYARMPSDWMPARNSDWGSQLIDQTSAGWPQFFADQVIAPLWAKGYRGFFLDTLDSYQRLAHTPEERAHQEAGLIEVIRELKRRWPSARLIFNRGFEVLPVLHQQVWMVAAESLYRSWDVRRQQFIEVSEADRNWLLGQLHRVQKDYRLPVLVIDYVAARQRQLARSTATRIRAAGFIPYVTTPNLDILGVGNVEVLPRKVLVIYDPHEAPELDYSDVQRYLGAPLAYLGLVPEYHALGEPLPDYPLMGTYAGIVTWFSNDDAGGAGYASWLLHQVDEGLPLAVFDTFGFGADPVSYGHLGISFREGRVSNALQLQHNDPLMSFELPARPRPGDIQPLHLSGPGQALLTLKAPGGPSYEPAGLTPWGGYVLAPYTVSRVSAGNTGNAVERWYVDPMGFLVAALRRDPAVPVPDVTTELGRRMFMVHIDGDGFPSKVERPGYPYAGRVLVNEVLKRYPVPTALSVIEGEVGPAGLYPRESPQLETIAREAYALPWVELASHTYSHPFQWDRAQANEQASARAGDTAESYHLPIRGYRFSLEREISGSSSYINRRLAPPGKRVQILFWSGNCVATPEALAEVDRAGLLNMNGGDTLVTRSSNSWTRIAGLGISKAGHYQVYAPNQNENVYTNLWSGPFYGFERVIETYQLTESPYRFKPIDLYYHLYNVTKTASLTALHKVYHWALSQPVNPVYPSAYIRKVLDFNGYVVARTPNGYRLRGAGELRTVRLPATGSGVDFERSSAVAGLAPGPRARYVSLAGGNAELVTGSGGGQPYIESANGSLRRFERRGRGFSFELAGAQPLHFTLNQPPSCRLLREGKVLSPASRAGNRLTYELSSHESLALRLDCGA